MTEPLPRFSAIGKQPVLVMGKRADPKAKGGLVEIATDPTAKDVAELRSFLEAHGPRTMVRIGKKVALGALEHVAGAPVVLLEGGRRSFEGLGALPSSVRRLSIGKHAKAFSLAELSSVPTLEQLELDVPAISEPTPLPALRTLGWTRMSDEAVAFVAAQPKLYELGLRKAVITTLPASRSVERLILWSPTKLTSLTGFAGLPALRLLRVDAPKGMARLGSLEAARALETLILVSAHLIKDLSDLPTVPKLDALALINTRLDEKPFLALKGKVAGGSFLLKTTEAGKRLLAHLGVPYKRADLIENHFFDG